MYRNDSADEIFRLENTEDQYVHPLAEDTEIELTEVDVSVPGILIESDERIDSPGIFDAIAPPEGKRTEAALDAF